jgi:hypothetical protein
MIKKQRKTKRSPRRYRLPTDVYELTTSARRYLKEWYAIMNPLKKIPGVQIHGFDPSVQIRFENEVTDMPVRLAKALGEFLNSSPPLKSGE